MNKALSFGGKACGGWARRTAAAWALLAALGPALAAGQSLPPGSRTVGETADLAAAIVDAKPGDVIRLREGSYRGLALSHVHFDHAVMITSADSAHPATIAGLSIVGSSGLIFSKLKLSTEGSTDPVYGFRIQNSDNVVFDDVIAYGVKDVAPTYNRAGFYITRSSNITISNSQILHMGVGVTANIDKTVTIRRNLFNEMAKSGIGMGAVSSVVIADNVFTNFVVGRGVHPDGIQIYTATMPEPSHDIAIVGNLIYRGRGNAIQGVFIQDEGLASPFTNVSLIGNAVIGGMWDSLYVKHAAGQLIIKDNIAASWAGLDMEGGGDAAASQTKATTTNFSAFLWLRGDLSSAKIAMTGNRAQTYMGDGGKISPPRGNATIGDVNDQGRDLLNAWMANHTQVAPLLSAANRP